jgi:AcrR family transcriptional regulator
MNQRLSVITAAAGVSKGRFYVYFESTTELIA